MIVQQVVDANGLLEKVMLLDFVVRVVGESIKRQPLSRNPTSVALSNDRRQGC